MLAGTSLSESPAAIRVDLGAIFVSMELSRAKWLITSLGTVRLTQKRAGFALPGCHIRAWQMGALKALQALRRPPPLKSLALGA